MSRTKKVFYDIYESRRKIFVVLMIVLIVPIFQNCAGGFSSGSSDSASAGAGTLGVGGGGINPPVVVPPGSTGPTLDQIQKACKALTKVPVISAPSVASVTVKSGLGAPESGDEKTPVMISISSADRGITDLAAFTAGNCNAQYSLQLDCAVVENDGARPISMTNGVNAAGDNVTGTKTQANLAKDSYSNNNCSAGFAVGGSSVNFSIRPNTNNQRCSEGNFTIRLTVRNSVTGQGAGFTSAPQYLSVRMNNGCWNESKLKDSANLPAIGNFGSAVAINGSWAAAVSPTDDAGAVLDVGTVYMFKLEGSAWNLKQKIQIATAQARDTIASVAINGSRMVIGSPSPYPGGQGNAYFYTQAGDVWTLGRQISPPVSQSDQAFGQKVAINATQIFIGAPSFNSGGQTKAGAVYVYNSDGSALAQTLSGATAAYAAFGTAIAVDGNVMAVGAPQAVGREAQGNGSVFIYTNAGSWSQAASKTGGQVSETYGSNVAVFGNRLAVSSTNFASGTNSAQGRVYVYNSYSDVAAAGTLTGQATGDRLGQGLALSSTGVYVGVPGVNGRAGRVDHYLYSALNSVYFRNIPYNSVANGDYGNAVAASGSDVVIGSRIRNDPNDNSGAAFIYRYK